MFASSLFTRLYLSYVAIICAAFVCYTLFVVMEAAVQNRADARRRSQLKLQELSTVMESQLLEARTVASRVNSSLIVRDLYLGLKSEGRAVPLSTLYQSIQELKSARATANNTGIYDVLLFLFGDYRVYSSSDVIVLPGAFAAEALPGTSVFRGSVHQRYGLGSVADFRLYKEYVVYCDNYSYDSIMARGLVMVLFDVQPLQRRIASLLEPGMGFTMRAGTQRILGTDGGAGERFSVPSSLAEGVSYELTAGRARVGQDLWAATAATILIGLFVSAAFLLVAYSFSRAYYRPIGRISTLFGKGESRSAANPLEEIATDISTLLDERKGYREAATRALPFVRQAALHALLTQELAADEIGYLVRDSGLPLQRRFYLVAMCNIGAREAAGGNASGAMEARGAINEAAAQRSDEATTVLCYEKDGLNTALLINGDAGDVPVDVLYEIHESITARTAGSPFVVTIGADEVREDLRQLPLAYRNATQALDGILLGGRGEVYFHDPGTETQGARYWFPADTQVRVTRALGACDPAPIAALLDEIQRRNRPKSPGIGRATRLVLYELYVVTVRAVGRLGLQPPVTVNAERTESFTTIGEVIAYYKALYAEVCARLAATRTESRVDDEIVMHVTAACMEPGVALKNVADRFGVSMKHVEALFTGRFNVSFARFVHDKRIERAVELLRDPAITLEQVGARCGYTSALTFRRHFQKATGMNPSDYRRENGAAGSA